MTEHFHAFAINRRLEYHSIHACLTHEALFCAAGDNRALPNERYGTHEPAGLTKYLQSGQNAIVEGPDKLTASGQVFVGRLV
jgi:hypothetical protein